MNRKEFLHKTVLGTVALSTPPFLIRNQGALLHTVLIGSGWWGTNIIREAIKSGKIKVVAICDVDDSQLAKCKAEIDKLCNDRPKTYKDFRECLSKEKPQIAIVATPDHWHALIAIEAMKTGAHVFLDKPISHTILEGAAILKTARDTQRVCIVDFHRRYSPHNVSGMQFLKSGKAGTIKEVKAFVQYGGGPMKREEQPPVPQGLDWDMYCGPAALATYNKGMHPRGWRQYTNFANGMIGDWGPHWFDQILWWTEETAPKKIFSAITANDRESYTDAPTTQTVIFQFESFKCTWDHSLFNPHNERKTENVGVYFYGTEGVFHMGWQQGWTFFPNDSKKETLHEEPKLNLPDQQNIDLVWQDFLKCIQSGQMPHADIAKGRQATNMALLGMLSARIGRSIEWDDKTNTILNDPEANKLLMRKYRGEWKYPV